MQISRDYEDYTTIEAVRSNLVDEIRNDLKNQMIVVELAEKLSDTMSLADDEVRQKYIRSLSSITVQNSKFLIFLWMLYKE